MKLSEDIFAKKGMFCGKESFTYEGSCATIYARKNLRTAHKTHRPPGGEINRRFIYGKKNEIHGWQ